jgi:hypothetical protein
MRICLIFFFVLFASNLPSQERTPAEATMPDASPNTPPAGSYVEREEKQFQFYPGGRMTIHSTVSGNVRIIGWKKGIVRIEAEKIVRGLPPEQAKSLIGRFPIRTRWNQTSAVVEVGGSPADDAAVQFNLAIYIPGDKIDLKAVFVRGDLSVESANGWIEVSLVQGNLRASSMSGYFSGSIEEGDIQVEMTGTRWNGLEFAAATKMGSIDLWLPPEYSAALQMETLDGKVSADYPPKTVDGEPAPWEIGIRKKAQALQTTVGEGGAPVKLITNAGDIRLSVKR